MIIYKLTSPSGKIYIGLTIRKKVDVRWKEHIWQAKHPTKKKHYIHNAINKYGPENFTIEVLESNIESEEKLREREKYYVALYDSSNPEIGYNQSKGGDGLREYKHHPHPFLGKKRPLTEEQKASRRGWKHSTETKKTIGEASIGRNMSEKTRLALLRAKEKEIRCIETGEIFESIKKAESYFSKVEGSTCVKRQLAKKCKTAYGYTFEYVV